MDDRLHVEDHWPLLLLPLAAILLGGLAAGGASTQLLLAAGIVSGLVLAGLWLTALIDVAWLFSFAIALALFSGHWRDVGLPSLVSPDRLVLCAAFVVLLLRDPELGRRPYFRFTLAHAVLLAAAAYAICSAIAAQTIGHSGALFPLLDRFGLVPFLLFAAGPLAFATEHQRRILLGTLLAVGAYLGLTALCEGLGLNSLLFPHYLATLGTEVQEGRARGPFGDAAVNGVGLFYCAVAAAVAYATIPRPGVRRLALAVGALCLFDLIFTQERSVWLGALAGIACAAAMAPQLRRRVAIGGAVGALALVVALVAIPGLRQQSLERIGDQRTAWDRLNLNGAAENMIGARPLFGFGYGTFKTESAPYFQLDPDFPLTNPGGELHNVFLSTAVELGLLGALLWLAAGLLAIGGAVLVRGPPELYSWRVGLGAMAVMWLLVANLVPMLQAFPNYMLWLWAGVVWPWRYAWEPSPARAKEAIGDAIPVNG